MVVLRSVELHFKDLTKTALDSYSLKDGNTILSSLAVFDSDSVQIHSSDSVDLSYIYRSFN